MSDVKFVQPTVWNLSGGGIQVQYSVAGPHLHYHDHVHVGAAAGELAGAASTSRLGAGHR
jgi:hypothetical protein